MSGKLCNICRIQPEILVTIKMYPYVRISSNKYNNKEERERLLDPVSRVHGYKFPLFSFRNIVKERRRRHQTRDLESLLCHSRILFPLLLVVPVFGSKLKLKKVPFFHRNLYNIPRNRRWRIQEFIPASMFWS